MSIMFIIYIQKKDQKDINKNYTNCYQWGEELWLIFILFVLSTFHIIYSFCNKNKSIFQVYIQEEGSPTGLNQMIVQTQSWSSKPLPEASRVLNQDDGLLTSLLSSPDCCESRKISLGKMPTPALINKRILSRRRNH